MYNDNNNTIKKWDKYPDKRKPRQTMPHNF